MCIRDRVRGVSLVAVTGSIGAAAVGNEDEIILDQVDGLLLTVFYIDDLLCDLLITFGLYNDIFYIHTVLDLHAMILKIFYQRQDHALVLVVFGETQGAEIRQAVNMMHIAAKITLHFQSARPALESEHRLPIEPEICAPEGFGKHIGDLFVFQILFLC